MYICYFLHKLSQKTLAPSMQYHLSFKSSFGGKEEGMKLQVLFSILANGIKSTNMQHDSLTHGWKGDE